MAREDWARAEETDAGRTKRLAGSYVAASAVVVVALGVGVVFGGTIKKQVFEEEVEVKFVPPEPAKTPPPPPPPPPPPMKIAIRTRGALGARREAPPTAMPTTAPEEGDPNRPRDALPEGEGDPNGCAGCTGKGGGGLEAPPAPPPPEPEPTPAPVLQVVEVTTPPVAVARAMPGYPTAARKQGVEAVVVVKLVIDAAGRVESAKVLRGHPLFDEAVLAAVRDWTFIAATLEGKPVRVARVVSIPFRLKT